MLGSKQLKFLEVRGGGGGGGGGVQSNAQALQCHSLCTAVLLPLLQCQCTCGSMGSFEHSEGEGDLENKNFFEGKHEPKLEFPKGRRG